jgi:hypothetical protein
MMKKNAKRRDAFQNGNFKAGGVGFKVRDVFQAVEIDGTRDVFPTRQLCSRRVQS